MNFVFQLIEVIPDEDRQEDAPDVILWDHDHCMKIHEYMENLPIHTHRYGREDIVDEALTRATRSTRDGLRRCAAYRVDADSRFQIGVDDALLGRKRNADFGRDYCDGYSLGQMILKDNKPKG